jgi:hypothetical protein
MMTSHRKTARGSVRAPDWQAGLKGSWWSQHREASLNWLALGLLLAAWNASDSDPRVQAQRRPQALRGYTSVSVRAAVLHQSGCRPIRTAG